jgi:formate dehydrogenase maturation protein FdhE
VPRFPHISIHACRACSHYLLNIDLSRDARAVPLVDEMAATPLDLYAKEQGVSKLVPNLMGF